MSQPIIPEREHEPGMVMKFVHRRRGGAELFLLLLSLAVGLGAYAAVGLGIHGELPADMIGYGVWLLVLLITAHVAVRLKAPYADPILLPVVAALNGLGLAMIYRIDLARNTSFADNQLLWMSIGVGLFIFTLVVLPDHRMLQGFTYTTGAAALLMLLLPLLPGIGHARLGARIWIQVGSLTFQPGEVAKVLLVIAFAGYLVQHRDALALAGHRILVVDLPRGRDLGPILVMWLISLGILVFQNDLGSSLLFFGLFVVMLYVATERPGWIIMGVGLFGAGAALAYKFVAHVEVRVTNWLDPFVDVTGASYQLVQSMYGMAWGGLVGQGLGQGNPYRTPLSWSDFIFSALGEELGLTGSIAIILMYGLLVERGLRIALVCRDDFGKLMAIGLATVLALQTFTVIGGVTRLIPMTGLTTPFLSAGGSSLIANWVLIALLLRVSDQARKPAPSLDVVDMDSTQVVRMRGML